MKKKPKIDYRIIISVIFCITLLEIYALSRGVNGLLLATVIAILAAIAGVAIPTPKMLLKE